MIRRGFINRWRFLILIIIWRGTSISLIRTIVIGTIITRTIVVRTIRGLSRIRTLLWILRGTSSIRTNIRRMLWISITWTLLITRTTSTKITSRILGGTLVWSYRTWTSTTSKISSKLWYIRRTLSIIISVNRTWEFSSTSHWSELIISHTGIRCHSSLEWGLYCRSRGVNIHGSGLYASFSFRGCFVIFHHFFSLHKVILLFTGLDSDIGNLIHI